MKLANVGIQRRVSFLTKLGTLEGAESAGFKFLQP